MTLLEILNDWKLILSSHVKGGPVVERFIDEHTGHLTREDIGEFLDCIPDSNDQHLLHSFAQAVRQRCYGNKLFVRGVIEITNRCSANCKYCQMWRGNKHLERYTLESDQIIQAAKDAKKQGITTLMLQGGEYNAEIPDLVADVLPHLKEEGFKIILSLGSLPKEVYSRWRSLGADAYIIKFETSNPEHHKHVRNCELKHRLACIDLLLESAYSVGSGLISDLPHPPSDKPNAEADRIASDILLVQERQFSLCSVSPFIMEADSQFFDQPDGSRNRALNIIALLRIANPTSLIPAVSAIENLNGTNGQIRGINAGANVITINFTPETKRNQYKIYGDRRFIVTAKHVAETARGTNMVPFYGDSTGPCVLGKEDETHWFVRRYTDPLPLAASVYGSPSDLGLKYIRFAKDLCDEKALPNLDLGGGDGRYAVPMMLQNVRVRLIDTCSESLARLRARMEHFKIDKNLIHEVQRDVCALELTETFSSVTIANLLYYLSDEESLTVLTRAMSALVPGGLLYISVEVAPVLELLDKSGVPEPLTYFRIASQRNYTAKRMIDLIKQAECLAGTTLRHFPDGTQPPEPWFDSVQLRCHHKRFPGYEFYARRYNVAEFLFQKRVAQL